MSEFVEGFESLKDVGPAIIDLRQRAHEEDDWSYKAALKVAEMLARRGFAIISGGGPGIMEAANRGARARQGASPSA